MSMENHSCGGLVQATKTAKSDFAGLDQRYLSSRTPVHPYRERLTCDPSVQRFMHVTHGGCKQLKDAGLFCTPSGFSIRNAPRAFTDARWHCAWPPSCHSPGRGRESLMELPPLQTELNKYQQLCLELQTGTSERHLISIVRLLFDSVPTLSRRLDKDSR